MKSMQKWKIMSVFVALLFALMACQGANDDAQRETENPNIDPTTNRNTGNEMFPRNEGMTNNDRDYMVDRDADRNQERRYNNRGDNNRMNNSGMNNDGDSRYDVASEAADKITEEIDEIDNAYVITTENNAYVAANLDIEEGDREGNRRNNQTENRNHSNRYNNGNDSELTDEVEKQIGEIVRSVDNDIENVYVSTNPDFLNLVTNYADDMDQGRPIGGMFDQIGEMIDRIFPNNR